jgi:hypothetical protein
MEKMTKGGRTGTDETRLLNSLLDTHQCFPYDHTLRQGKSCSDF